MEELVSEQKGKMKAQAKMADRNGSTGPTRSLR